MSSIKEVIKAKEDKREELESQLELLESKLKEVREEIDDIYVIEINKKYGLDEFTSLRFRHEYSLLMESIKGRVNVIIENPKTKDDTKIYEIKAIGTTSIYGGIMEYRQAIFRILIETENEGIKAIVRHMTKDVEGYYDETQTTWSSNEWCSPMVKDTVDIERYIKIYQKIANLDLED
jgi:hypothetical protein